MPVDDIISIHVSIITSVSYLISIHTETPYPPEISWKNNSTYFLCLIEIYNGHSPILNYNVTFTGAFGYTHNFIINKTNENCTSFQDLNYNCSPFITHVFSMNAVGASWVANASYSKFCFNIMHNELQYVVEISIVDPLTMVSIYIWQCDSQVLQC